MNDYQLRQIFQLCSDRGRFVYEVCGIFGDKLSLEEMEYWSVYNVISNASLYDVDISGMSFEAALEKLEVDRRKRKKKWQRSEKGSSQKSLS